MIILPEPNKIVRKYLIGEQGQNEAFDYPVEATGRFLLPLDTVYFGFNTDQGHEILVHGGTKTVCKYHSVIKINDRFSEVFGVSYTTVQNKFLIRMPTSVSSIFKELERYFAALNFAVTDGMDLKINGKPIL